MTVSSQTSRIEQLGDGTTTAFAVNFYFLENSDLKVFVNGVLQTITTNYTVTGAGNPAGGTVTFVSAPANGVQVVIFRDPALTQGLDYIDNDPFPAESHERGLDKLTMIAQRIRDLVSRALRLGDSVVGVNTELPALTGSQLLGTNPGGTGFQLYPLGSEPDTAANIVYTPSGTGAVATTVEDKLKRTVSVKDFGAVGDGMTNDTEAFSQASAYIESLGGGTLIIPPGIYVVGKQTFAGATGLGYSYKAKNIIKIHNCTKPVVIEGNGAILKAENNLRFGSFDPVTGDVYNPPTLPFTDPDFAASSYIFIDANLNKSFEVRNLEIDGNIQNLILGGQWGDTGRQIPGDGVRSSSNEILNLSNVYTHHCALDGVIIAYPGLNEISPKFPSTLYNVVSEYNARQGLSWVGGTQLTAINCKFNHTGKSTFSSAPSAGVDIEAETSVCRNGVFINCEMQNNSAPGLLANSGNNADVIFLRCKFVGQSSFAIWPNMPRFSFIDCAIIGAYANPFASTVKPDEATKFIRCLFSDESKYANTLANVGTLSSLLSATNAQQNVVYESCTIIVTRSKAGRFDGAIIRDTHFEIQSGTSFINNRDWFAIFWGAKVEGVTILDNITTNVPIDSFYLEQDVNTIFIGKNNINSPNQKLKWANWSFGGVGDFQATAPAVDGVLFNSIALNSGGNGFRFIGYRDAPPSTGPWVRGDKIFNNAPAVGSPKGWVCTISGTPGTWVSEGNL